ncbi:MAG TPA: molybdopterin molybdotransferase MoeA [Pseudolysinimonas sp.]
MSSVDWAVARERVVSLVTPLGAEEVPLAAAIGRVAARDVVARLAIPHYASSAMDGWAVAGPPPWRVTPAVAEVAAGSATPVVTGALIPAGANAVLRSEHGEVHDGRLGPRPAIAAPLAGADIRPVGQEADAGDVLIPAGTVLNPAHIAIAAACTYDLLPVVNRPRVALLLTGDEVDVDGIPSPGRVRDSFGPVLPAVIERLGGAVTSTSRVPDRLEDTVAAIDGADRAELIITTGGTGRSDADHLRAALQNLDAELVIPRVAMRPGGPTLLAALPDGRLVIGLAGNPLAAIVGLLVVAAPALARWSGRPVPHLIDVVTARDVPGRSASTSMIPYQLQAGLAVPSLWVGPGMMRGLAGSSGILIVPPAGLSQGESASAFPLPW